MRLTNNEFGGKVLSASQFFFLLMMNCFDDFIVLSWNVRGATNATSKRHCKELIKKYHPSICVLLETHVQFGRVASFWNRLGYFPAVIVEANGHAGGIWVLTSGGNFSVSTADVMAQCATVKIKVGSQAWFMSLVYASPIPSLRYQLWDRLISVRTMVNGPWMLIGDFNEVLLPSESIGGFSHVRAWKFGEVLSACNLTDLEAKGFKFTWHRHIQGVRHLAKKLDRALVDLEWRDKFPEAFVENLGRLHSDHHPILLRCGGLPMFKRERPFRFEVAWSTHKDYQEVVSGAWSVCEKDVLRGLDIVRDDSIIFNKFTFGNIFRNKRKILARLVRVQNCLDEQPTDSLAMLEKHLWKEYNMVLQQEELFWYQKSREKWVQYGDRNTKFFHSMTMTRRKRNRIHDLFLQNENWCTEDKILQSEALHYFKDLFCSNAPVGNVDLGLDALPMISDEGKAGLVRIVSKEEVYTALMQMESFKALGADGFHAFFFKKYWHIVGEDVWNMVREAFIHGSFDRKLAETLVVLIPKMDAPTSIKQFRPISLCKVIYKIIMKVLVNRIRPLLDSIIGPLQGSFVPGWGTTENALIAQEIMHYMNHSKSKKGSLAVKFDLEKAYDRVEWDFLQKTLEDFGFPENIVKLIMYYVKSSSLTLL